MPLATVSDMSMSYWAFTFYKEYSFAVLDINNTVCERSNLSCCNKFHTCQTRDGYVLTVTTVVNAPRTVITGINAIFVAIAHNVVQPYLSATGTVGVASDPTDASSCTVNSNSNNNSRIKANLNHNLGTDVLATSHLRNNDCTTNENAVFLTLWFN